VLTAIRIGAVVAVDLGMLGMLPGVLGSAPLLLILPENLLDICYNLLEVGGFGLRKGSNIVSECPL
jgi:hypothetical protein